VTDESRRDGYDKIIERDDIVYRDENGLVAKIMAQIILTHEQIGVK
jgi:hypothetical protein